MKESIKCVWGGGLFSWPQLCWIIPSLFIAKQWERFISKFSNEHILPEAYDLVWYTKSSKTNSRSSFWWEQSIQVQHLFGPLSVKLWALMSMGVQRGCLPRPSQTAPPSASKSALMPMFTMLTSLSPHFVRFAPCKKGGSGRRPWLWASG